MIFKALGVRFLSVLDPSIYTWIDGKNSELFSGTLLLIEKFIEIGQKRDFAKKVPEKRHFLGEIFESIGPGIPEKHDFWVLV